jgi:hypothetical protein
MLQVVRIEGYLSRKYVNPSLFIRYLNTASRAYRVCAPLSAYMDIYLLNVLNLPYHTDSPYICVSLLFQQSLHSQISG